MEAAGELTRGTTLARTLPAPVAGYPNSLSTCRMLAATPEFGELACLLAMLAAILAVGSVLRHHALTAWMGALGLSHLAPPLSSYAQSLRAA
jgi:hypothetical protein